MEANETTYNFCHEERLCVICETENSSFASFAEKQETYRDFCCETRDEVDTK